MRHYWEVLTGAYTSLTSAGCQDMIVHDYVYKRRAALRQVCVYGVRPSLVEHTGAISAVFGGRNNSRYHMSQDYPFFVQMPMLDDDMSW